MNEAVVCRRHGIPLINSATELVDEYWTRRTLAKLGYRFDGSALTADRVFRLMAVEHEVASVYHPEPKKKG